MNWFGYMRSKWHKKESIKDPQFVFLFPVCTKSFKIASKKSGKIMNIVCVSRIDNLLYLITFFNVSFFGEHLIFIIINLALIWFVCSKSDELKFYIFKQWLIWIYKLESCNDTVVAHWLQFHGTWVQIPVGEKKISSFIPWLPFTFELTHDYPWLFIMSGFQ